LGTTAGVQLLALVQLPLPDAVQIPLEPVEPRELIVSSSAVPPDVFSDSEYVFPPPALIVLLDSEKFEPLRPPPESVRKGYVPG
jgi:hypothetical protein